MICKSKTTLQKINVTEKLTSVKKLLNDWSFRDLSIIGKITVIKSGRQATSNLYFQVFMEREAGQN